MNPRARRWLAHSLSGMIVFHAALSLLTGGIYDRSQPQSYPRLEAVNELWHAAAQDPAAIRRTARAGTQNPRDIINERELADLVTSTLDRHRAVSRGDQFLPPELTGGIDALRREGLPRLPEFARVIPSEVTLRTAIFEPTAYYEILATTPAPPASIFDHILDLLIEQKFLLNAYALPPEGDRGYVIARREGVIITAILSADNNLPGSPTLLLWVISAEAPQ